MDFDDILNRINAAVISAKGKPLKDVERLVLRGAWDNQTYGEIADAAVGYTEDYLKKDVGPKLWQLLSEVIGQNTTKVTKKNIQSVLTHWVSQTETAPEGVAGGLAGGGDRPSSKRPLTPTHLVPYQALRIDVSEFYGRELEQTQLTQWIQAEGCRLVVLWGLKGMGKTTLAMKVVEHLRAQFDACAYLPLTPELTPDDFLAELAGWLWEKGQVVPDTWEKRLDWVLDQFEQRRCLLVVDNGDALFAPGQLAGSYRPGFSPYQTFLQQVGALRHRSCVLWISREKPGELALLQSNRVRSHLVADFSPTEAAAFLLPHCPLVAQPEDWQQLVQRYSGSPLVLKSLITPLQDVYRGNLRQFLEADVSFSPATQADFAPILERLTPEELTLLYWLAVAQGAIALEELNTLMIQPPLPSVVQSLLARALCQVVQTEPDQDTVLDLSPIIRHITLQQLQQVLGEELARAQPQQFHQLPLLWTTAAETIQAQQTKALLYPLAQHLRRQCSTETALNTQVQQIHQALRTHYLNQPGYGASNLIHLCQALDLSLSGVDFSRMAIWQGNLQQVSLQGANLSHVQFRDTVFATALGRDPVAACSQDGEYLAVGDHEGRLLLWKIQRGKLMRVLENGISPAVRSLAFSLDGDLLAVGSEDGSVQLWSLQATYEPDRLPGHTAPVRALAFSPRGDLLATGDDAGYLYLWDLASGMQRAVLTHPDESVQALQFDPQGNYLLSSGDQRGVYLWHVATGKPVQQFQGQATDWIKAVGFSPEAAETPEAGEEEAGGALAMGYDDRAITAWDIASGRPRWILPLAGKALLAMAVSADGRYLACSHHDRTVSLWHIPDRHPCCVLRGFVLPVWFLTFSPDSRWLITGSDYTVKIWDGETGSCLRSLWSHRYPVQCLTFGQNGSRLITGHGDALLRLWQVSAAGTFPKRIRSLSGHTAPLRTVTASPQGYWWASSSDDQTIRLWDGQTGRCDRVLTDEDMAPATVLAFSADGQWLVSGGEDALLRLWQVDTGQCLLRMEGHTSPPTALVLSRDGEFLVSGGRDRLLRIWHLRNGQCRQRLPGHQGQIHSLSLSPDDQMLLSTSHDGTACWWSMVDGKHLGTWHHPQQQWLHRGLINGAGQLIAITSDMLTLELWSILDNQRLHVLRGHTHEIWEVLVSPDQQTLATASQDEEIRIWRLDMGTCEQVLRPDRPYEGVNIRGAEGLSEPEERMLRSLGATFSFG